MKNILHIINGEFYSGAERVQDLLALCLPESGYLTHLACIKPGMFRKHCACPQETVHDFPMKSRVDLSQVQQIVRFVKKNNIAILHTHTPRAALIGLLVGLRTGIPRVHHVHSPTSRDTENRLRNLLNTAIERISVIGTRQFIAVSSSIGKWAASTGVSPSRITVVPNGVPCQPERKSRESTLPLTVGVVALFRPRKGLEVLIRAIHRAKVQGTTLRLHAIGGFETEEYKNAIHALVQELGVQDQIIWRGFQQDIPAELSQIDIFALPSLYGEGMPMVILEAMAAGLPIVASDVEGIPEVLGRDGRIGFLSSAGDAETLAMNLVRLTTMAPPAREALGAEARARHAAQYSDKAMAANVAKVYANVLAK